MPPPIRATIQRRILVNYRVDPDALAGILPEPFRPALVGTSPSPASASSAWAPSARRGYLQR